jgi:hypothetical protein
MRRYITDIMSDDVRPGEVFEIEPTASGREWHIPWWLLLAVAIVVTELTAHPAIGVAVFCLKFGLNDWRTAAWLCRVDPQPRRSHSIWWFLVGSGCLKIFLVSSIAFPVLAGWWRAIVKQNVLAEVRVAMTIGLCGMFFSFVVNHVGLYFASRRGVRVWLNRQLHQHRDANIWPVRLTGANRLRDVLNGSALPAILAFIAGIACLIIFGMKQAIRPAIISGTIAMAASLILLGHGLSVKRVVARSPDECWADLPELEPDDL